MSNQLKCPVCESGELTTFLTRSQVPVHQNLVQPTQDAAVSAARGDLTMVVCDNCGFVFNATFDASKLSYGPAYDNSQHCSSYFSHYTEELANHLVTERDVRHCRIVEVGCGKGSFLRMLVQHEDACNTGYGFDPSYVGPEEELNGRLRFFRKFYGRDCANLPVDVVVCRHVIEHVPNPLELLGTVREALIESPHSRIFFETPCIDWILRNQVIWDFFYEHCSLFSTESLSLVFQRAGFDIKEVRHLFGGQYLWIEASVANRSHDVRPQPGEIPALARNFGTAARRLIEEWTLKLQRLTMLGKVAVWGAGAKGATFAHLFDPTRRLVDCIVDVNPNKQGHYLPGTGHPIVAYKELETRGIASAILMNLNYREENELLLKRAKIHTRLVE